MGRPELLAVRDLTVWYPGATTPAITGLDLDVAAGECVAVLGPSGGGKSTLCRALLDLLPRGSRRKGSLRWRGRPLTAGSSDWRSLRGAELGLVLQDHRHALDPVRRVGAQLAELVALWRPDLGPDDRRHEVASMLTRVGLDNRHGYAERYPHQLSGGQRQRVNLAAALAGRPALLLADEPTTALDLPVQRDVLALLARLVRQDGLALLLVTHDRDLLPLIADHVVELGHAPARPGPPTTATAAPRTPDDARLIADDVRVDLASRGGRRDVVRGVSLELTAGEVVGLCGASGCGKTTLVRTLAGWLQARRGRVSLRGPWPAGSRGGRQLVQLVSQDASAALDPQQSILAAVVEAARRVVPPGQAEESARALLAEMDLGPDDWGRRPAALSGGQRQRAQLARALAVAPWFLLADEPASSLDPARRDLLLDLLARVRQTRGVGVMIVAHDLGMLEARCDRVLVMQAGLVVEGYRPGPHAGPLHPAAQALAAAAPERLLPDDLRDRWSIAAVESSSHAAVQAGGCPHAAVCPLVEPACTTALPGLVEMADGRLLRCPVRERRAR